MFADSLCDSTWARTSRRGWNDAGFFRFAGGGSRNPAAASACLYTEGLPKLKLLEPDILVPPRAEATHTQAARGTPNRPLGNMMDGQLMEPGSVPKAIEEIDETVSPIPQVNSDGLGAIGGRGRRNFTGVAGSPGSAVNLLPPPRNPWRVSPGRPNDAGLSRAPRGADVPTAGKNRADPGVWFSCRRSSASGGRSKTYG